MATTWLRIDGNETVIRRLSADEQAGEVSRWGKSVARTEKEIASVRAIYATDTTNAARKALTLATLYKDLGYAYGKLSDALYGDTIDEHAARRNAARASIA